MRTGTLLLSGVSIATLTLVSSPASSQTSAQPAVGSAAAALTAQTAPLSNTTGDQEIVVTAQKRSQNINKVGLTIQAFGSDTIAKQGIKSVADLTKIVPGLTVQQSVQGAPVYTLRGVGFYDNTLASYPAVSVYTDEAPLAFPVTTALTAYDLERIEVLKGPQGILFGQNSTGGAINYILAKPTNSFHFGGSYSHGNYNTNEENAYVSGPITDTLSFRVAVHALNSGNWQYNYYPCACDFPQAGGPPGKYSSLRYENPDEKSGKQSLIAGRVLLDWHPSDRLDVSLNVNAAKDTSDPQAAQLAEYIFQDPQYAAPYQAIPLPPHNAKAASWTPLTHPKGDHRQQQASLRADYHLTDAIQLTSITSYLHWKRDDVIDDAGSPLPDQEVSRAYGKINTLYQELRLSNGSSSRFRWVVGGNYSHDRVIENDDFLFPDATSSVLFQFGERYMRTRNVINSYGLFGNGEFDVGKLTLKAGIRWSESDRHYDNCSPGDAGVAAVISGLQRALTGNPNLPDLAPTDCLIVNTATGLAGNVDERLNENNVSWRAGVDYHLSGDTLLYFNIAKGYKAGGFAAIPAGTTGQLQPIRQESVLDLEGGFKVQLFDRRLSLNGAGFYYQYRNKQLLAKVIDPVFGPLDAVVNVPKSSIRGGEVSLNWTPFRGFVVSAAATYLDATVDKYIGLTGFGADVTSLTSFAGTRMPYSPKFSGSLSTDYSWKFAGGYAAFIGQTSTFTGSQYSIVGAPANSFVKKYYLLDLRAGVTTPDGKYTLSLYGRNVTNSYYWTNQTKGGADTIVRFTGMPVTYGASIAVKF